MILVNIQTIRCEGLKLTSPKFFPSSMYIYIYLYIYIYNIYIYIYIYIYINLKPQKYEM